MGRRWVQILKSGVFIWREDNWRVGTSQVDERRKGAVGGHLARAYKKEHGMGRVGT